MNNKDKNVAFEEMDGFIKQFIAWDPEKAAKMEKPWLYWDNGYTRFRRMLWERKQKNS